MTSASSFYIFLYLAALAWVSWLPVIVSRHYKPPFFWRWTILLASSGPLLSGFIIIGFILIAQDVSSFDTVMMTGWMIILFLIPFQLLVAMTVYLFICSSLKERRKSML
jgi:glucose-6-phosphate-specific signal transduction histidine kinase